MNDCRKNGAIVPFWEKRCAKNHMKRHEEERRELGRKQSGLFTICNLAYLHGAIPSLGNRRKRHDDRAAQELVLSPSPYEQLTVFLSHEMPSLPIHWNRKARRLPFRIPTHEYALLPGNLCVRTIFHYLFLSWTLLTKSHVS